MSPDKDTGTREELRRHSSDLVTYLLILAAVLLGLKAGCLNMEFPSLRESAQGTRQVKSTMVLPDQQVVLSSIQEIATLTTCEGEFETLLSRDRTLSRWILPDGHVTTWAIVPTRVEAGVDLSELREADLTIDRCGNSTIASLQLPAPIITSVKVDTPNIRWGSSSNFPLVWEPDREALDMRTSLVAEAQQLSSLTAIDAGLLDEARIRSAETISRVLLSFGVDEVTIRFPDGQTQQSRLSGGRRSRCSST